MKKIATLIAMVVLAVCLMATPALAAPGNGNGAVKTDIWQIHGGGPSNDKVVGSVIMNTNASGEIIVVVNLDMVPDQGGDQVTPPLEDYDVRIWVDTDPLVAPGPTELLTENDCLDTNARGQGNATVKATLGDYGDAEEIWVSIVVRDFNGIGLGFYETLWNQVPVPLKK